MGGEPGQPKVDPIKLAGVENRGLAAERLDELVMDRERPEMGRNVPRLKQGGRRDRNRLSVLDALGQIFDFDPSRTERYDRAELARIADPDQELRAEAEFFIIHVLADENAADIAADGLGRDTGPRPRFFEFLRPAQITVGDGGQHGLDAGVDGRGAVANEYHAADVGLVLNERRRHLEDQLGRGQPGQVGLRDAAAFGNEPEFRRRQAGGREHGVDLVFEEGQAAVVFSLGENAVDGLKGGRHSVYPAAFRPSSKARRFGSRTFSPAARTARE